MTVIAIIHHSGYGHTRRMAEFVQTGVTGTGAHANFLTIDEHGDLPQEGWDMLAGADGIIFGTPTYMGGPTWQFKKFADASSKQWFEQKWKDKFAAGFTNSASMSGDKSMTISWLMTLAMQQGMVWVGTGTMPANLKASPRETLNYVGGFSGALAQTPSDASVAEMSPGDLETAQVFGARVASFVAAHKA